MIAMGWGRFFSTVSSLACNSSIASKARFNGESSVVFMVDSERSIGGEITFAPAVLKAEPRLHHRIALQSLERGPTPIRAAVLRPLVTVQPTGLHRTRNPAERRRWMQSSDNQTSAWPATNGPVQGPIPAGCAIERPSANPTQDPSADAGCPGDGPRPFGALPSHGCGRIRSSTPPVHRA